MQNWTRCTKNWKRNLNFWVQNHFRMLLALGICSSRELVERGRLVSEWLWECKMPILLSPKTMGRARANSYKWQEQSAVVRRFVLDKAARLNKNNTGDHENTEKYVIQNTVFCHLSAYPLLSLDPLLEPVSLKLLGTVIKQDLRLPSFQLHYCDEWRDSICSSRFFGDP